MLINNEIKTQLSEYFKHITRPVRIHTKNPSENLNSFLSEIVSLSNNLSIVQDPDLPYRNNSFELYDVDKATGIVFSGIPGGHEFNSFILAILSIFGLGEKLTDEQKAKIKNIDEKIVIEIFVTLSCTFCPGVVQSLNKIALNNSNIIVNTIDGNEYIAEVREKRIVASPTVFINGEFLTSGAQSTDKLIEIITAKTMS
ncbi:thioredoxin family protein [uncultured Sneathia sp.]|uniref:thioredoxin family protein n=1 Tax=uncultured Sneathia sp. TaxID=278067 RepID=UPI0028046078|nr:thioredoxin family protein [uncultured Sneathia sp.]